MATVDNSLAGQFQSLLFAFESPGALGLSGGQVLLCLDGGSGELLTGAGSAPVSSTGGIDNTLSIPGTTELCDLVLYTQALQFGAAPFVLSNAQDLTLGS